jgi:uncharacterized SAM-binding protein YcdF (DUF218 family)
MSKKRASVWFLSIGLALFVGWSLFVFRQTILTRVGNYLVAADPVENADAIEILAGGEVARCKSAAELFRQRWAPLILVTRGVYPDEKDDLIRYGIPAMESHEMCLAILSHYKIPASAVEVLDGYNESTADEARKLRSYVQNRGLHRLIIVTSNFHTRRAGVLFRRIFHGTGVRIVIQAAPPDIHFDPKGWWKRRRDAKTLLWEYQKLTFYAARYW